MTAPHVPAAFINAIAEEGSKAEAIEWLQKTWNELCEARAELETLDQANCMLAGQYSKDQAAIAKLKEVKPLRLMRQCGQHMGLPMQCMVTTVMEGMFDTFCPNCEKEEVDKRSGLA